MALNLDTRIPLLSVDPNFNPSKSFNDAADAAVKQQQMTISNRLEKMKADREEAQAEREVRKAERYAQMLASMKQGTPAQMSEGVPATQSQYQFGQPEQTHGYNINDMLTGRVDPQAALGLLTQQPSGVVPGSPAVPPQELVPAVPGREPTPLEAMLMYSKAALEVGDPAGALPYLKEYNDSTKIQGVQDSADGFFGYRADGSTVDFGKRKKPATATSIHGDRLMTTVDGVPTSIDELPQTAEQKRKERLDNAKLDQQERRMAMQERRMDALLAAAAAKADKDPKVGALIQMRANNILSNAGQAQMELENILAGPVGQQMSAAQDAIRSGGGAYKAFMNNISRRITPAEANTYLASATGLDIAVASLMRAGYNPSQAAIKALHDSTTITAADTTQSAVYKTLVAAQHVKEILRYTKIGTPEQQQAIEEIRHNLETQYPSPQDWQHATVPGWGKNSMKGYMDGVAKRQEEIASGVERETLKLTKGGKPPAPASATPNTVAQTEFDKDWAAHPGAEDRKQMREYAKAMKLKVPGEK